MNTVKARRFIDIISAMVCGGAAYQVAVMLKNSGHPLIIAFIFSFAAGWTGFGAIGDAISEIVDNKGDRA